MMERAYRHIRAGLATGQFRPGAQLSELAIAQEVGVGRTPVREALLVLENEGFLKQVPRYGTFVKTADRNERQCMWELREVMEAYAASNAARYISDEGIEQLGRLSAQMRDLARAVRDAGGVAPQDVGTQAAIADLTFHMLILRNSGNPWLIKIVGDLHLMSRVWCDDPAHRTVRDWAQSWQEHERIYRAIRRRDSQAATDAMKAHLRHATAMALENYDRQSRTQAAEVAGYEWPQPVREALAKLERLGPNGLQEDAATSPG